MTMDADPTPERSEGSGSRFGVSSGWPAAVLWVLGAVLVVGAVAVGVAVATSGGSTSSTGRAPVSTGPAVDTTQGPGAASSSTSSIALGVAVPPCDAGALFDAAVAKEGFNPADPSYATMGAGQGAGATGLRCLHGWAMATISRPNVGTTDGDTLFRASGQRWHEVAVIGYPLTTCALVHLGVGSHTAHGLVPGPGSAATHC